MFTIKPNDVTVHSGDELYTEAVVNNAEVVSWLHQGKILSSAKNKIAIKFVNGKASLRIDGTTKKDEGDYTCLAKSGTDPHKLKEESVDFHVSVSDGKMTNCIMWGKRNISHTFSKLFLSNMRSQWLNWACTNNVIP